MSYILNSLGRIEMTPLAPLHPKTAKLVKDFSKALAKKLHAAQIKYGHTDGWSKKDWMDECRAALVSHIKKGDPLDVAAYAAFLWFHGETTTKKNQQPATRRVKHLT